MKQNKERAISIISGEYYEDVLSTLPVTIANNSHVKGNIKAPKVTVGNHVVIEVISKPIMILPLAICVKSEICCLMKTFLLDRCVLLEKFQLELPHILWGIVQQILFLAM